MSTDFLQQSAEGGKVMGVGGGIHDDAVDVTYSTKPDKPQAFGQQAVATTSVTTSSAQYNLGAGAGESSSLGVDLGATIGNTINLGSQEMQYGATTTTTTTTTSTTGNMGYEFNAGAATATAETTGLDTAEYQASTYGQTTGEAIGMEATAAGFEATGAQFEATGATLENYTGGATTTTTTTTTTTQYGMGMGAGAVTESTEGKIMGVGGGIHDEAVDVTYSTKPDKVVDLGVKDLGTTVIDQGTTVVKRKSITIPGGIASLAKTTTSTVGVDINSLTIYNRTKRSSTNCSKRNPTYCSKRSSTYSSKRNSTNYSKRNSTRG